MSEILIIGEPRDAGELIGLLQGEHNVRQVASRTGSLEQASLPARIDVLFDLSTEPVDRRLELQLRLCAAHCRPATSFVSALTMSATEAAAALGDDVAVASIGWLPGVTVSADLIEMAPALQSTPEQSALLGSTLTTLLGRPIEILQDRRGLVSARILAMVVNEAAFAVMEGVATPADIDTAMRLGTNYPVGPLAWADRIGAPVVVALLDALQQDYGEERYRPCVLLRQYARAGRRFHEE